MSVFNVAGYLIAERRKWPVIDCFPTGTIVKINSEFWKKGTFRWENRTSCLVWLKTHPAIVPRSGIELTTSRLRSFTVAEVSHAPNHSAMEAAYQRVSLRTWYLTSHGPTWYGLSRCRSFPRRTMTAGRRPSGYRKTSILSAQHRSLCPSAARPWPDTAPARYQKSVTSNHCSLGIPHGQHFCYL